MKRSKVSIYDDVSLNFKPDSIPVLLIHILEVLGSHSIQTAELKQIIGALRPLPNGQLVIL